MTSFRSSNSIKSSAWRRKSSAIIDGFERMLEATETRTPFFCNASTSGRKSPSPENREKQKARHRRNRKKMARPEWK